MDKASCVATFGKAGRLVAAVTFNQTMWLDFYRRLIERAASFPPVPVGVDRTADAAPLPAGFPDPSKPSHDATVVLTGYDPNEQQVKWIPRHQDTQQLRPALVQAKTEAQA